MHTCRSNQNCRSFVDRHTTEKERRENEGPRERREGRVGGGGGEWRGERESRGKREGGGERERRRRGEVNAAKYADSQA